MSGDAGGSNALLPIDIDREAAAYYESLQPAYSAIVEWLKNTKAHQPRLWRRFVDASVNVALLGAVVCILPIGALVVTAIMPLTPIGPAAIGGGGLGAFATLWIVMAVSAVGVIAVLFWVTDRLPAAQPEPPFRLSPEQLSFINAWKATLELRYFFANRLDKHVDNATRFASHLLSAYTFFPWEAHMVLEHSPRRNEDFDRRAVVYMDEVSRREGLLHPGFSNLLGILDATVKVAERAPWLGIDDSSRERIRTIVALGQKLIPHLKARDDLPTVYSVLNHLAVVLYAHIPDHTASLDSTQLTVLRQEGLRRVDEMLTLASQLSSLPTEAKPTAAKGIRGHLHQILLGDGTLATFVRWAVAVIMLSLAVTLALDAITKVPIEVLAIVVTSGFVVAAAFAQLSRGRRDAE